MDNRLRPEIPDRIRFIPHRETGYWKKTLKSFVTSSTSAVSNVNSGPYNIVFVPMGKFIESVNGYIKCLKSHNKKIQSFQNRHSGSIQDEFNNDYRAKERDPLLSGIPYQSRSSPGSRSRISPPSSSSSPSSSLLSSLEPKCKMTVSDIKNNKFSVSSDLIELVCDGSILYKLTNVYNFLSGDKGHSQSKRKKNKGLFPGCLFCS